MMVLVGPITGIGMRAVELDRMELGCITTP